MVTYEELITKFQQSTRAVERAYFRQIARKFECFDHKHFIAERKKPHDYKYWVHVYHTCKNYLRCAQIYSYVRHLRQFSEFKDEDFPFALRSISKGLAGSPNRSKRKTIIPQEKYTELPLPPKQLNNFAAPEELSEEESEELQAYIDKRKRLLSLLLARIYELAAEELTTHQQMLLKLFLEGKSLLESGKRLGICPTAVSYGLHGVRAKVPIKVSVFADFLNKSKTKSIKYGGVIPKLRNLVAVDKKCKSLVKELNALRHHTAV